MKIKRQDILEATLCIYLMQTCPEFKADIFSGEPSSEAYAAALQAIRLTSD